MGHMTHMGPYQGITGPSSDARGGAYHMTHMYPPPLTSQGITGPTSDARESDLSLSKRDKSMEVLSV
jgi:hypothetical protein